MPGFKKQTLVGHRVKRVRSDRSIFGDQNRKNSKWESRGKLILCIMPRSHRYARSRGRPSGHKYSSETSAFELAIPGAAVQVDGSFVIVAASTTYGVLKAKNATRSTNAIGELAAGRTMAAHMQSVSVFVREGPAVPHIAVSANPNDAESIYELNQDVISQGIFDSANALTIRTRLAGNLQAADPACMVIHSAETIPAGDRLLFWGNLNFALTY
jgi:hypothetical protein